MSPFALRVYRKLLAVPPGRVTTYKHLARAIGTRAYRAVGNALRSNPFAPEVPCHRVVANDGRIGGFMGKTSGSALRHKVRLLAAEGVAVDNGRIVDFPSIVFTFR